jgi:hypothetical protein
VTIPTLFAAAKFSITFEERDTGVADGGCFLAAKASAATFSSGPNHPVREIVIVPCAAARSSRASVQLLGGDAFALALEVRLNVSKTFLNAPVRQTNNPHKARGIKRRSYSDD